MPVLPVVRESPSSYFRRYVGVGKGVYLLLPVIIAPIGGDERGGGGQEEGGDGHSLAPMLIFAGIEGEDRAS